MTDRWLPLTSAQRGLFFAHELDPGSPACTSAEVVRASGRLDARAVADALRATYAEHEQLRVRLRSSPDGPVQQVLSGSPSVTEEVAVADAAEAEAWMRRRIAQPMELDAGDVVRSAVLHVADQGTSWWFHAAHHVVTDGFGFLMLARRVAEHLRGTPKPVSPPRLADLVGEDLARPVDPAVWDARLAAMTSLTSLAGAVADPAPVPLRHRLAVPDDVQAAWVGAGRRGGGAWTDVLQAALAAYLARLCPSRPEAVRIGVPLMNRFTVGTGSHLTASTVCTAMNVLPLQVGARGLTIAETVAQVRDGLADLRVGAHVRQEDLARTLRSRPGEPTQLFGPQVNLMPFDTVLDLGGGVTGAVANLVPGPVEDITWTVRGMPGRGRPVWLEVDANPRLYDADVVATTARRLLTWTRTFAAADSSTLVADLPLLDDEEHALVVHGFNASAPPSGRARTLPEAFAEQRDRTPDAVALSAPEGTWTYADLDREADRLVPLLLAAGAGPRRHVGVALPRSLDLFAAISAAHRVGAAYVPIDPETPEQRVTDLVADAGAVVVLTPELLAAHRAEDVAPDSAHRPLPGGPPALDDPAYVLFTSGSTGRPKGVVVTHRAIDNRLRWMQDRYPVGGGDTVLHKTPTTFDVSVWELFWPLQVGARIVVAEPGGHRDPRYLADLIVDERVDVLHFVPSMLRAFLDDDTSVRRLAGHPRRVRHLVCSGEALTHDLVVRSGAAFGVTPANLYGPTEAAVDVTAWETSVDDEVVPIGRPTPGTRCYVLDEDDAPVPVGVVGHLHLAGVQLAEGYAGRPDLTAEVFGPDPFHPGERMYRTGDLARWRSDGALLYEGRRDQQVKIRGQRVEPGEVEAALALDPGVLSATALAVTVGDDVRLEAFVVPRPGARLDTDALREATRTRLPAYLVPSVVHEIAELPLGGSGKVDRRALEALRPSPTATPRTSVPGDLVEQHVVACLSDLLGLPAGLDDDVFTLGAHSLLVLRLVARLEPLVGVPLRLADVFAAPTARSLAALVRARRSGTHSRGRDTDPVLTLRPGPGRPPLFALPPAGGLGWCYSALLPHLSPDRPVHALQAEGLDGSTAPPPADLRDLARAQLALIREVVGDGAFHLVGWSIGGMAAHTVAAMASEEGQHVGVVALMDSYPSDQWRSLPVPDEAETLRALLRMAGAEHRVTADELLDRTRVATLLAEEGSAFAALPGEVVEATMRNVVTSATLVRTSEHGVLAGDVLAFVAGAPRSETWLDVQGWAPYVKGTLDVRVLPGTHPDLVREPLVGEVARALRESMDLWDRSTDTR
ncbi:amino acid adenylation domain-containing protein [Nocardioides sp. W7]|uniref:amino acid adenylation domain-containing protein n=1 Tax=Nocardioides sp. W7 TaxID=2931390 RepID=UPI001FD24407|nr:amino acid adenylation domain-containing protein [Nocardioides sp. W7]